MMKFFTWLKSLPGLASTAIREDGLGSPLSSRRIFLMCDIYAGYRAFTDGFAYGFALAATGADWKVVALFISPFAFTILVALVIIKGITATDVEQLVKAAKGD